MSEELKSVLEEINTNIKLLVFANRQQIEKERKDFLGTGANRKILSLCNGKRPIKEIAKKVGITPRGVQYIVGQLNLYGFITLLNAPSGKAKLPKKTI